MWFNNFDFCSLSLALTNSCTPVNDSLRAQMESLFFPLVKPDRMKYFKSKWEDWFVLTDEIEDRKCPGKLKVEFFTRNGEMYALAPKTYISYCHLTKNSKDGRKGIPKSFPLTVKNFHDALYHPERNQERIKINSLRLNKRKAMGRCTLNRKSLSSIHCKLYVEDDNISCSPLKFENSYL